MSHEKLFDERTPAIRDLALAACALIQRLVPNAVELMDTSYQAVTYGTGKTMRGQLCYVAAFNQYINIGFYNGIDLPDPQKLLEGTGKRMRHVKIRQAADLENPALHDLIQASLQDITAS